jgi:hypothetical protein
MNFVMIFGTLPVGPAVGDSIEKIISVCEV